MQKSILWEGIANDTDEHCAVNFLDDAIMVRSEIEGWAHGIPVYADYTLRLDSKWNVQEFKISFHVSDTQHHYHLFRDEQGNWTDDSGTSFPEFKGCNYIDISLTPFTNSLPVNGLFLPHGESAQIDVVYVDIIANEIRKEHQKYTKAGHHNYHFENADASFIADIQVDNDGFVTHYPELFNMIQTK
ncbi:putative glycolipid-binding domain-containing protein [Flavobacterium hauense]